MGKRDRGVSDCGDYEEVYEMKKPDRCPFCGGCAKIRTDGNAYFVRCDNCGASSRWIYKNGGISPAMAQCLAIEMWNRRGGK